jgi:hypothetical protein
MREILKTLREKFPHTEFKLATIFKCWLFSENCR